MPLPEFTNDELLVIHTVKSTRVFDRLYSFMASYLIGGLLVAGFATYHQDTTMMLFAFGVVCGFRIYEECYQMKWVPVWRSVIEKYEAALIANDSKTAE